MLLLLHVPATGELANVVAVPAQIVIMPVIVLGIWRTYTGKVARQFAPNE
jgi:hypothetical protein